jgi:hypothetical protein
MLQCEFGQGDIHPDPPIGTILPDDQANTLLATGTGRAIITASRPGQRSYVLAGRVQSAFGQAFADSLGGGVQSARSGVIGLFELYETLFRQVRDLVQRTLGTVQEPMLTLVQGVGSFAVARHPGAAVGAAAELKPRPDADVPLREVPPGVVHVAMTTIDQRVQNSGSSGVQIGAGSQLSGVSFGDIAGGSIYKGTINVNLGGSPASDPAGLADRIAGLARQLDTIPGLSAGERDDLADDLQRAAEALRGAETDRARRRLQAVRAALRDSTVGGAELAHAIDLCLAALA